MEETRGVIVAALVLAVVAVFGGTAADSANATALASAGNSTTCPNGYGAKYANHSTPCCEPCSNGTYSNVTDSTSLCLPCNNNIRCEKNEYTLGCIATSPAVCSRCGANQYFDVAIENRCTYCRPKCGPLESEVLRCTSDHDRRCEMKPQIKLCTPTTAPPTTNPTTAKTAATSNPATTSTLHAGGIGTTRDSGVDSSSSRLDVGSIIGIAAGTIVAVVLVVGAVVVIFRNRKGNESIPVTTIGVKETPDNSKGP